MRVVVFCHLYYYDLWPEFEELLKKAPEHNLYVNVVRQEKYLPVINRITRHHPGAMVLSSPNQGRDIAGYLKLIDTWLSMNSDEEYAVFIHSKKSPQMNGAGDQWRRELLKIITPEGWQESTFILDTSEQTGMVCTNKHISSTKIYRSERQFAEVNKDRLQFFAQMMGTGFDGSYTFAGGSMFWIRTSILRQHLSHVTIDTIFKHYTVNDVNSIDHTDAHVFERLFGTMVTQSGYKIKGI